MPGERRGLRASAGSEACHECRHGEPHQALVMLRQDPCLPAEHRSPCAREGAPPGFRAGVIGNALALEPPGDLNVGRRCGPGWRRRPPGMSHLVEGCDGAGRQSGDEGVERAGCEQELREGADAGEPSRWRPRLDEKARGDVREPRQRRRGRQQPAPIPGAAGAMTSELRGDRGQRLQPAGEHDGGRFGPLGIADVQPEGLDLDQPPADQVDQSMNARSLGQVVEREAADEDHLARPVMWPSSKREGGLKVPCEVVDRGPRIGAQCEPADPALDGHRRPPPGSWNSRIWLDAAINTLPAGARVIRTEAEFPTRSATIPATG